MADNFFGITDIGKKSENNEDEFIAQKALNSDVIIAGVIDGVGGYFGGEIAAAETREVLIKKLSHISGEIIPLITETFIEANKQLFNEKKADEALQNMACVLTVVMADIPNNQLYYGHVGDTRLYLLRDGSLVKISKDHSFVGFLEDSGRLSEYEAMTHPKRNEINKALGFEENIEKTEDFIETGQSPFLPGDLLLICSDGLTDMVNSEEITGILTAESTLKQKGKALIDAANHHGGKDNITAVLVKNDKQPLQHAVDKPIVLHEPVPAKQTIAPAERHAEKKPVTVKEKSGNGVLITILTVLCLGFLGSNLWLYFNGLKTPPVPVAKLTAAAAPHTRNAQELKLQDTINKLKGNTLILSAKDFTTPIIISDTLDITKDTLLIKAKGNIVLQADTGYKGAGIMLAANCKHIVLDSLGFDGFKTAVFTHNSSLTLKNIRFADCGQPLMELFLLPGKKYVTGQLAMSTFSVDSLPKHPKK